jgi:hypothetical protein
MSRWLVPVGLALLLCTASLQGQDGFRRGKIKKIDLERRILSLALDSKDEEFQLTEDARLLGASGKNLRERLQGIKEGVDIFFKATKRAGCEGCPRESDKLSRFRYSLLFESRYPHWKR